MIVTEPDLKFLEYIVCRKKVEEQERATRVFIVQGPRTILNHLYCLGSQPRFIIAFLTGRKASNEHHYLYNYKTNVLGISPSTPKSYIPTNIATSPHGPHPSH
jgi:hypothetical protein